MVWGINSESGTLNFRFYRIHTILKNSINKKPSENQLINRRLSAHDWSRTSTSIGHHPLKMACLPIPPREHQLKLIVTVFGKQKKLRHACLNFCDLTGARTQDPLLKREMLYQLSYQVEIGCKYKGYI